MTFQKVVNRQYTFGFIGEIVRDGTLRAKPGRIASATVQADGSTNRVGYVFGYAGETGTPGTLGGVDMAATVGLAGRVDSVEVGGTNFFGILFHPKHYALTGTTQGGSLAPSLDLLQGMEGEFVDMTAGVVVNIVNTENAVATLGYGAKLAYVPKGISTANNPLKLALGTIVAVPASGTVPTGMQEIPNTFVITPVTIPASAAAASVMSTPAVIQMTN